MKGYIDQSIQKQKNKDNSVDWCYFTMEDALLFGSLRLAILCHTDRMKISCQSLLVNTIPLILTDAGGQAWCNPTYYILAHLSNYATGKVLKQVVTGPTYDSEKAQNVLVVDSVSVENEKDFALFFVNRSHNKQIVQLDHDFSLETSGQQIVLKSEQLSDKNLRTAPTTIFPQTEEITCLENGKIVVKLDPCSWNVIKIKKLEEK